MKKLSKAELTKYWIEKKPQVIKNRDVCQAVTITQSDLIFAWKTYCKYNSPHPCKMPSAKAEAGRLILRYGQKALKHAEFQKKPTPFLGEVMNYLRLVGYD